MANQTGDLFDPLTIIIIAAVGMAIVISAGIVWFIRSRRK
jgi:hypothetical protein